MIDTQAINARVNLLDLIGQDLRRVSGDEHAGPCPKCDGTDRFHCTPTWWFCRQCHEKRGDAIAYLQWRDGLTFVEACEQLGGVLPTSTRKRQSPPAQIQIPSDAWQDRARAFIAYAHDQLWQDPEALRYLQDRGLSDETIEAAQLGYCPKVIRDDPGSWGLEGRSVYIAKGWVIPCESGGVIHYVKIRQPQGEPKYLAIRGSKLTLYGLDDLQGQTDSILVEGEFDALLLRQHVADVCGVAALGSATKGLDADALAVVGTVRRVFAALDSDGAGQKGAGTLAGMSERVRAIPTPCGEHDITDGWRAGCDLLAWALSHIGPVDLGKRGDWLIAQVDRLAEIPGRTTWQTSLLYAFYEECGVLDDRRAEEAA